MVLEKTTTSRPGGGRLLKGWEGTLLTGSSQSRSIVKFKNNVYIIELKHGDWRYDIRDQHHRVIVRNSQEKYLRKYLPEYPGESETAGFPRLINNTSCTYIQFSRCKCTIVKPFHEIGHLYRRRLQCKYEGKYHTRFHYLLLFYCIYPSQRWTC